MLCQSEFVTRQAVPMGMSAALDRALTHGVRFLHVEQPTKDFDFLLALDLQLSWLTSYIWDPIC